jgi:hypothetical protein
MNKNLKDRADRLMQGIYLDGYEHGYKDALKSVFNYEEQEHYKKLAEHYDRGRRMTKEEKIEMLETEKAYLIAHGGDRQAEALTSAIQALEQEPCKDMEEIREVINCDADAETKCKMISNILTAKPHYFEKQEPKWIPVSERLPKDIQPVLLTIRRMSKSYNHKPFITVGHISCNQTRWWCAHDGDCTPNKIEVIAWMPLPEPYKAESEDKE